LEGGIITLAIPILGEKFIKQGNGELHLEGEAGICQVKKMR
jgi:hypothetical protein